MSSKQIECDSELLASLRQATPEELDVLVDVITDYARGRAGLDADDKRLWCRPSMHPGAKGTPKISSSCWDTNYNSSEVIRS